MKSKIKKISAIFCAVFLFAFSIFLIPKKVVKADNELTPSGTVYTSNTYFCSLRAFYGNFSNPNAPQYKVLTNSFLTAFYFTLVEDEATLTFTLYYFDYSISTNTQHVNQSGATNTSYGGVQNLSQQIYCTRTFSKTQSYPYSITFGNYEVPYTNLEPSGVKAYMFPCVYSASEFDMINAGTGVYDLIGSTVSQYYIPTPQNTTTNSLYFACNYYFLPTNFTTLSDYEGQSCTVSFNSIDNFAYGIQSEYIAVTLPFMTFSIPAVIPREETYTLSFGGGITPESDNEYYQLGYNNGYSNAQNSLQVTYENRINQAYTRGYQAGQDAGTDFYQYFLAIAEVPFNLIFNFLNFNILGVNIANFVTAILTGLLVIGAIRLFI